MQHVFMCRDIEPSLVEWWAISAHRKSCFIFFVACGVFVYFDGTACGVKIQTKILLLFLAFIS